MLFIAFKLGSKICRILVFFYNCVIYSALKLVFDLSAPQLSNCSLASMVKLVFDPTQQSPPAVIDKLVVDASTLLTRPSRRAGQNSLHNFCLNFWTSAEGSLFPFLTVWQPWRFILALHISFLESDEIIATVYRKTV